MPSKSPTDAVLSLGKMGCFVLCLVHVALALPNTMQKRATAAVPPARIDIPLLFDSNGRYIIPVGMVCGVGFRTSEGSDRSALLVVTRIKRAAFQFLARDEHRSYSGGGNRL